MVHQPKSIHRSTGKQQSNRLKFILEPIQNHTLLVWSVLALLVIGIGYEALSILINPGEIEPEEAIVEIEEGGETLEGADDNFTLPWLWLGAIALASGGIFLLWKTLQNPTAHKRAALNRRQRRGASLLSEKPQPLRVPQRQPIAPFSLENFSASRATVEAHKKIPEVTPQPLVQPQKPFSFDLNRTAKPVQNPSLQVPNFPKLTPDIPQGSVPKPVRKKPPQEYQDQEIRKSS